MEKTMSISAVSARYRVSPRTLRFYEEAGILKSRRRDGSNYREYDTEALRRLEIILLLRGLGFTVKEISELMENRGGDFGGAFNKTLERKITDSDRQLLRLSESNTLLHKLRKELSAKPAYDISAAELLSEFIYLTNKTERSISMSEHAILIGTGIIDIVTEDGGGLLRKIPALRAELKTAGVTLPQIRVRDENHLGLREAVIIWGGKTVFKEDFSPELSPASLADILINQLREFN